MNNLPEKMVKKFGYSQQLIKLMEELGECSTAIARFLANDKYSTQCLKNYDALEAQVVEEIIDVEFLFAQMRHYFDGFEEAKKKNDEEIERRFFK